MTIFHSHAGVSCSPALILALVIGVGALLIPSRIILSHPRETTVFAIVLAAFAMVCIRSRRRLRPYSAEEENAMAEAVQRQRRIFLVDQARLEVEYWLRELDREVRQTEEAEELVPPPYSRQPKLPTWCEHADLRAQGEEERGVLEQPEESTNGSLSNSVEDSPRKESIHIGAAIRRPPPSYSPR